MIYFTTSDHRHVLVLEPSSFEELKGGAPLVSTDKMVIVAYSPDIQWTFDEMKKILDEPGGAMKPEQLTAILKAGISRPMIVRNDEPRAAESAKDEASEERG